MFVNSPFISRGHGYSHMKIGFVKNLLVNTWLECKQYVKKQQQWQNLMMFTEFTPVPQ